MWYTFLLECQIDVGEKSCWGKTSELFMLVRNIAEVIRNNENFSLASL